jgi:hypothetical protein
METIARWLKRLGLTGCLLLGIAYIAFAVYGLPRFVKVHITGTEIARKNVDEPGGETRSFDVRYVMAEDLDGDARMFRNQDTDWGWPPHFKFDSGDLAAEATNLATGDRDAVVLVKYYGFRIHMISAFPNILSMREVPPDYQPIPWYTIFFVIGHVILIGVGWVLLRDFRESREEDTPKP